MKATVGAFRGDFFELFFAKIRAWLAFRKRRGRVLAMIVILLSCRAGAKCVGVLMPILGLSWVFGLLAFQKESSIVFQYLFAIANSSQVRRRLSRKCKHFFDAF